LDFVCRANNTIVLGETKFITDFGGHQDRDFDDAMSTLRSNTIKTAYNIKIIAILDGVLYIPNKRTIFKTLKNLDDSETVISALLLRDYLYSL